ncbi:MAG TPA: tryptophan halogenase family protein [Burkholderiales bacterium]|nr:tryptophan halogenase family protein [Burkholderiales bacterium]
MEPTSRRIKDILVVGGGTAGWMTAALLNRFLPADKCRVTLVESAAISTIGVGEATVPPLVAFVRSLGISEGEFMAATHASYKLAIKFVDWRTGQGDDVFWHPFGPIGGSIDHVPVFHHWLSEHRQGRAPESFYDYSLQVLLSLQNKAPRTPKHSTKIIEAGSYAYHFDASAFARFLMKLATRRGVQHVVDDVRGVVQDERGYIRHVETQKHGALAADLFIDCTGFAGLLIDRTLHDPYVSWSDYLLCDRAWAMSLDHGGKIPPYTQATALKAGWEWRIPLSHRIGAGYVFSSRFISEDAARTEFLARNNLDPDKADPKLLHMRIGHRTKFWIRNCVAVGLASGFIEPLESTGIYLIQKGASLLLDNFPDDGFSERLIGHYNRKMEQTYQEVRDFIILHYLLNERQDTEFWKANRRTMLPDSLAETLALYDETGVVNWENASLFGETSFLSIVAGMGRLPGRHLAMADFSRQSRVREILGRIKADNLKLAQSLPDHGDYVRTLNAAPAPA